MKTNFSKIAITIIAFVVIIYGLYSLAKVFSPGSYTLAELYEIDADESSVIEAAKRFKLEHPEFIPPDSIGLKDGRNGSESYWYFVFYYYPKENQLLNTWIRASDNGKSIFALTAVNNGTTLGNWKRINGDISSAENEEQKKKFEERILNKIKGYLKDDHKESD